MFASVGSWTPSVSTITADQMSAINANMQNAWDVIGGGTYTPVTQTVFNGTAGVQYFFSATGVQIAGLGGLHVLTGSTAYIDAGGAFVNNGTQTLNGTTVYNAGVTFNSTVTVGAAGAITVNAASTTTLNGPLAQVGAATFSSTAAFNGAASIGATGSFATNAAATSTFNGPIVANSTLTVGATGSLSTNAAATSTFSGPCTFADLTMTSTNNVKLTSRSITRTVEHAWVYLDADWNLNSNGYPASTAVGKIAWLPLHFPNGVTIDSVVIYIDPAGGHGALPAVMPSIEIFSHTDAGLTTSHGSATDASGSVVAYEALHTITIAAIATAASRQDKRYVLKFTDESGGNSVAGQQLKLCTVTYTTTAMDED